MFKKLLGKVIGKPLAAIVDEAVVRELESEDDGGASKVEEVVETVEAASGSSRNRRSIRTGYMRRDRGPACGHTAR